MQISPPLSALLLGVVQALTEFLPISSSGHVVLISHLLQFTGPPAVLFTVVVQLGTTLAVMLLFWRRIVALSPYAKSNYSHNIAKLTIGHLLVALFPIILSGLLFYPTITRCFSLQTLPYGLLAGSLLMVSAERLKPPASLQDLTAITYRQAAFIGCLQCFSLCPGFSRSGATLAGGLLVGLARPAAVEFSFLLSVPTLIGASGLELCKKWHLLNPQMVPLLAVGFSSAFLTARLLIHTFLVWMQRSPLTPFALYRIFVALLLYKLL